MHNIMGYLVDHHDNVNINNILITDNCNYMILPASKDLNLHFLLQTF